MSAARALADLLPSRADVALAWYSLLAVVLTWPLGATLTSRLAGDLGDPLLICWVIGWVADHFARALTGDVGALAQLWHANIFAPERYTLAYSEAMLAPAAQALPVYLLTGNLILCYNLLLLATYALSGLGMYLLVRQITANWRAAFVAGLIYGFLPYRAEQVTHLHVQSSQWMPFVLYFLRRYFDSGRISPLAGAAAAFVMQNLSSGYYFIYFSLFVPVYVLLEMLVRRRLADVRTWLAIGTVAAVVAAITLPLMWPYVSARETAGITRTMEDAMRYSADVLSYATATEHNTLWGGRVDAYRVNEGQLFPGFTAVFLASVGIIASWRGERRALALGLAALAMLAVVLSFGPEIRVGGAVIGSGPYAWLFAHVPGFDGLRVAARFAMVAAVFFSVLAGFGVERLMTPGRHGTIVAAALSVLVTVESAAWPYPVNRPMTSMDGRANPSARLSVTRRAPSVYRFLGTLPRGTVVVELPFGNPAWELRYMYYSTAHWHPLVNGFSGYLPASYVRLLGTLRQPHRAPEAAWSSLGEHGVTHVVLHPAAYGDSSASDDMRWLEAHGARLLNMLDGDYVYEIPR